MLNPKEQYVRLESWGSLLVPIRLVSTFEHVVRIETEYVSGRTIIKLREHSDALCFTMVPKEDVIAAIAVWKLEDKP
jgi:hypothetical protein